MIDWWYSLGGDLQFFYLIAILATFALILQTALLMIGGDLDALGADFDLDMDTDAVDGGFGVMEFLSLKVLTAFFFGFGWFGVATLENGWSFFIAILMAIVSGAALMILAVIGLRSLKKLEQSGNIDLRNAIGSHATVYITIPGEGKGDGQVELTIQGRVRVLSARTSHPDTISPRSKVFVVDVDDDNMLVVRPG